MPELRGKPETYIDPRTENRGRKAFRSGTGCVVSVLALVGGMTAAEYLVRIPLPLRSVAFTLLALLFLGCWVAFVMGLTVLRSRQGRLALLAPVAATRIVMAGVGANRIWPVPYH